ncbi:MAG: nucleotide exchange factor GrpE [Bacteroidetes bacterium]|nr:nucleotide exchange factor GrpE [Bacteroidota bacterium]
MKKEFTEEKDESLDQSAHEDVVDDAIDHDSDASDEQSQEEQIDPLQQCTDELAAEKDQRLRITAEFANYRRRMENQRIEWSVRAKSGVIRTLLPIIDDLERSLIAADQSDASDQAFESLKSGLTLINQNFVSELQKLGLKRIDSVGSKFDEHLHEAVGQTPAIEDQAPGLVVHESQAGYRLGDQVLRHAKVIVSVSNDQAPQMIEAEPS